MNLNVSPLMMDNYRKGQMDDATWNDIDGLFVDYCGLLFCFYLLTSTIYELSFLLPKLSALHSVSSFMMREENIDHISRKDDALARKSSRSFWHS